MWPQASSQGHDRVVAVPNSTTQPIYDQIGRQAVAGRRITTAPDQLPEFINNIPAETRSSRASGTTTLDGRSQAGGRGRTRPLDEFAKLKADLIRKLRACDSCRKRKVSCKHFDWHRFEHAYQATLRAEVNAAAAPRPNDAAIHIPYGPSHPPPSNGPGSTLFGINSRWAPPIGHPSPQGGFHGAPEDHYPGPDPLQPGQHSSPLVSRRLTNFVDAFPHVGSQNPNPTLPFLPALTVQGAEEPTTRIIGKHVAPNDRRWICFGDHTSCWHLFPSLDVLQSHFDTSHTPMTAYTTHWTCIHDCTQPVPNFGVDPGYCPCSEGPNRILWCAGSRSTSARPIPQTPLRVHHQGGPPSYSSLTSSAGKHSSPGGYTNTQYPSSWASYSSPGYGGGRSYNKAAGSSSSSNHDELDCDQCELYSLPGAGGVWTSLSLFSIHGSKTALRHICPAAVVLAVYLLVLAQSQYSTGGVDGIGPSSLASALLAYVIPGGRIDTPMLPLAVIVAGALAMWLFRHVKTKVFDARRAVAQQFIHKRRDSFEGIVSKERGVVMRGEAVV